MDKRFSLHKIHHKDSFSFSPKDYSLFKFGDLSVAKMFGKALFRGFIENHAEEVLNNDLYVFPSPFMAIPTASNYLSYFFKEELDYYLFLNNLPSAKTGKIHRNQTYTIDYGNLSFEERKKLIANDTYYIDRNAIQGKTCLFIDDIRITGSHEYTVQKILNSYEARGNFIFIYFAELMNKDIHPSIENFFNYYEIDSHEKVIELINKKEFTFNTRIIKFILNLADEKFAEVMENINDDKKTKLFQLAISNDYHLLEEYKDNLKKLYHGNQFAKRTKTKYWSA